MISIDFWVNGSKVKVTVTLNIKNCPLNNLIHIQLRDTIIGVLVGHGKQKIHGVSRSKVKVTVTLSINSSLNNLKLIQIRDTIIGVLVDRCP